MIAANGRGFVAGEDLDYFRKSSDQPAAAAELIGPIHGALKKLAEVQQIIIGSLKGPVASGGMSFALNLDLLVAADDTTFNLASARVATSPHCGGSWALPRLVGFRKALEIALLSETIGAEEAARPGLVNRVVPAAELEAETRQLARRLAAGPAVAQGRIKTLMRRSLERDYADQLDSEAASFGRYAATRAFDEAIDAFFSKRKPVFEGR